MNTVKSSTGLRGIVPPMITPLLDMNTLDRQGVENLVQHMMSGGVSGIFILGTTGEAQHLSMNIRMELIRATGEATRGKLPLLVGITDTSIYESLHLANVAAECGAAAVVAAPPYYFAPGQPELIEYYEALADQSPLPLYLYNMPSHTKVMIEPDTVYQLAKHPNIVGLKDSSANAVYFHKLLHLMEDSPEFALFVGPEEMMASVVLMGAHGGVSGGANLYPRIFVELYNAAAAGELSEVRRLQSKMMCVGKELYNIGRFGSGYIKGLKTALSLKGICNDYLPQPFNSFRQAEREKVILAVEKLDKLLS